MIGNCLGWEKAASMPRRYGHNSTLSDTVTLWATMGQKCLELFWSRQFFGGY